MMNRQQEYVLREYIRREIRTSNSMSEGVVDDLRKRMTSLGNDIIKAIDSKISALKGQEAISEKLTDLVLDVEGGAQVVSSLSKIGSQFTSEMDNIKSIEFGDKSGTKSEASLRSANQVMTEMTWSLETGATGPVLLREVTGFEMVGMGLALIGGIPMLLKGMYKVAGFFRLKKISSVLEKAYKAAHHFEESFVSFVVPDAVSYRIYTMYKEATRPQEVANFKVWEADPESGVGKTIKKSDRILTKEEYKTSKEKKKLEKGLYVIMLTPWLINGLFALKHFVSNMISWAEAGATAVKGAEAVEVVGMASDIIQQGLEASNISSIGSDVTTALTSGLEALEVADISGLEAIDV